LASVIFLSRFSSILARGFAPMDNFNKIIHPSLRTNCEAGSRSGIATGR
jgi:hypothetical protein